MKSESARRWRAENVEYVRARDRKRAKDNPEENREKSRRWGLNNPEKKRVWAKRWYDDNRDLIMARRREWRRENPEIVTAQAQRRRARKSGTSGSHTADDIRALSKLQRNRCAHCKVKFGANGYHVDHINPLAKGGGNGRDNIQLLCPTCNTKKRDLCPYDWANRNWMLL